MSRVDTRPKDDWECKTPGCYRADGHYGEHEPGMCECGADMDAHAGGWVLLAHDEFMARRLGAGAFFGAGEFNGDPNVLTVLSVENVSASLPLTGTTTVLATTNKSVTLP